METVCQTSSRSQKALVQMNLQLIEEDLSECCPPGEESGTSEHLGLLRSTQREIRRLGSLVTDFLTYARPSTPRRAPCSFDGTIRDGVQLSLMSTPCSPLSSAWADGPSKVPATTTPWNATASCAGLKALFKLFDARR